MTETTAATAAVSGFVLFYHRGYDTIMLVPLFFALLLVGWRERALGPAFAVAVLAMIFFLPWATVQDCLGGSLANWAVVVSPFLALSILFVPEGRTGPGRGANPGLTDNPATGST